MVSAQDIAEAWQNAGGFIKSNRSGFLLSNSSKENGTNHVHVYTDDYDGQVKAHHAYYSKKGKTTISMNVDLSKDAASIAQELWDTYQSNNAEYSGARSSNRKSSRKSRKSSNRKSSNRKSSNRKSSNRKSSRKSSRKSRKSSNRN